MHTESQAAAAACCLRLQLPVARHSGGRGGGGRGWEDSLIMLTAAKWRLHTLGKHLNTTLVAFGGIGQLINYIDKQEGLQAWLGGLGGCMSVSAKGLQTNSQAWKKKKKKKSVETSIHLLLVPLSQSSRSRLYGTLCFLTLLTPPFLPGTKTPSLKRLFKHPHVKKNSLFSAPDQPLNLRHSAKEGAIPRGEDGRGEKKKTLVDITVSF